MKKITLFILLFSTLLFNFSCEKTPQIEDVTEVELTFKGKFGNETFLVDKDDYQYNNVDIRFEQFNFYVSNVVLVKETTNGEEETELIEIDFVDLSFSPSQLSDAQTGVTIKVSNVPVGDYDGIKIGLGVPADLNKNSWDEFGNNHPLRKVGHYWAAWESFIFSKTEANLDVDNDGGFSHKLSYHTGADEAYRTFYASKNITLTKEEITNLSFDVDVEQVFDGVDVIMDNGTHNITDMTIVEKVMSNIQNKVLSIQ